MSLDNFENNVGIHNKDNKYAYYNSEKLEQLTPNWFNKLYLNGAIISFIISFIIFFYYKWEYLHYLSGFLSGLLAAVGVLVSISVGIIVATIIECIRSPFNKSTVEKFKNDILKIL